MEIENFQKVVGLPNENYEITYEQGKIYGLAYINQFTPGWICNAGTLPYLFGRYQSFSALNDFLPEGDNDYMGTVFFELNEDLEPTKVITRIRTTKTFELETSGMEDYGDHIRVIAQVSYLDGDNIPKLEFEI